MTGASSVQLASALLTHGPQYLKTLREDLARWLEKHEYTSLAQAKGSMSLKNTPQSVGVRARQLYEGPADLVHRITRPARSLWRKPPFPLPPDFPAQCRRGCYAYAARL